MFRRLTRIRNEFGTFTFVRTVLLLLVAVGMSVIGYFGFASIWPAITVAVGLGLGWILRSVLVDHFEHLSSALPASLFIYGIVLFVGEHLLGLSREGQVLVFAAVSVITFSIQFWTLSDDSIVSTEGSMDR